MDGGGSLPSGSGGGGFVLVGRGACGRGFQAVFQSRRRLFGSSASPVKPFFSRFCLI